jgi:hypothetical protein
MNPRDKQMAEIKDKADLIKWVDQLPAEVEGMILVRHPDGRILVRHLGDITLSRALWSVEQYKKWIIEQ